MTKTREIHILSPEEMTRAGMGLIVVAECGTSDVWHNWTPIHQYATCKKCRAAYGMTPKYRNVNNNTPTTVLR